VFADVSDTGRKFFAGTGGFSSTENSDFGEP
jgi:hypothetical protein